MKRSRSVAYQYSDGYSDGYLDGEREPKRKRSIEFKIRYDVIGGEPMNVLFIGDIHIKHTNREEIEVLMKTVSTMNVDEIDAIIVAGDVLDTHERVDVQLMNRAYDLFRMLRDKKLTYVLVGNHDYINNQQFLSDNHWMTGLKEWRDVVIVDRPIKIKGDLVLVPYVFPGRFVEALDNVPDWKSCRCIFAHQEIRGCKMGAFESTQGDEWDESWPSVISGHIHERQVCQPNVFYPGSIISHAFGETEREDGHGLSVFKFRDDNTFEETVVRLNVDRKRTLFISVGDKIDDSDMIRCNKFSMSGSACAIAAFKQSTRYKDMKRLGLKVVFRLKDDIDAAVPKYLKPKKRKIFTDILSKLVEKERNVMLEEDYKMVFKV